MAETKLVGQNYETPDIRAKVTGRARYAEDFRAPGMLFARLLLSPYSHAKIRSIDTSAALAMPGVKAILLPEDVPGPKDQVNDMGQTLRANPYSERALASEPLYQGEPVLAVCAVDEATAVEAIEKIKIRWDVLPFNVDPVATLRPGAATARVEGNVWVRPTPKPGEPPPLPEIKDLKWTEEQFAEFNEGRLPMGEHTDPAWSYGDVDAGFKKAALVLDETFVTPNTSHQCLESRSCMAYWQNGKLHIHLSTQSTIQTVNSIARWLSLEPTDIVLISEYCGGGYGSKATGSVTDIIPALIAKKTGTPVMMRLSREDEHMVGRARPAFHSRVKVGFTKDGRITAVDMFTVVEGGPYGPGGDGNSASRYASLMFQPESMRWRGITAITNTPPRGAQSQPGGMQGITIMEPIIAKAARQLGVDQVQIRKINSPEGKAKFGPPNPRGERTYTTSCFLKEALDKGAREFDWDARKANSRQRVGTKVRGVGVAVSGFVGGSTGFDALLRHQTGRPHVRPHRHRQSGHRVDDRLPARRGRNGRYAVGQSRSHVGRHLEAFAVELRLGRQPDDPCAHPRLACRSQSTRFMKLQQIAAKDLGGRPEDYVVANERVAAKGRRSGHDARESRAARDRARRHLRRPRAAEGHQRRDMSRSATALAGQGLMGVAKDNYKRDGATYSFVAAFAEVEVDVETGAYDLLDYHAVADVGTVIHPRALGGQILGRSILGIGHAIGHKWVYDQRYGVALAKRFYQNKPPTILDVPTKMSWSAVELAGSGNAGGREGDRRAAGRRRRLCRAERYFGRGRRRGVSPRAGQRRHDSYVARGGTADGLHADR